MNTKKILIPAALLLVLLVLYARHVPTLPGRPIDEILPPGTPISIEATLVYQGTLPTESGLGIETTLTLMDRGDGQGGGFNLKEVYILEGDEQFEATGQWETRSNIIDEDLDAEVYVLTSEEDSSFKTQYYEIIDENTIRRLSDSAERIPAELAYELELQ